jgi:lipopolysaccharide/colanic/teichoic acid biosynthesis glycosyltransferase
MDNVSTAYKVARSRAKRCFDAAFAAMTVVALTPLMGVIALAVKVSSRGPVIFRQERCGLHNRPFTMYKFRTMVDGAESMGLGYELAKDDDRITRMGKILRISSLDELPQLVNIIKGDMSLIGPRPMTAEQTAKLTPGQMLRQQARPGISGWAQVNGRNALDWSERLELDAWYVQNWSLPLDLMILWKTVFTVIRRDGLYGTDGVNKTIG